MSPPYSKRHKPPASSGLHALNQLIKGITATIQDDLFYISEGAIDQARQVEDSAERLSLAIGSAFLRQEELASDAGEA